MRLGPLDSGPEDSPETTGAKIPSLLALASFVHKFVLTQDHNLGPGDGPG